MARQTLYPRSAGEVALDRLLNETLPRLVESQQEKKWRNENRQLALDQQEKDNIHRNKMYELTLDDVDRGIKTDLENNVKTFLDLARNKASVGDYDGAATGLEAFEISFKKTIPILI